LGGRKDVWPGKKHDPLIPRGYPIEKVEEDLTGSGKPIFTWKNG